MTPEERSFEDGKKDAYMKMLLTCLAGLGEEGRDRAGWVVERRLAVLALRSLCEEFGDNDWGDNLSLADVIDKHLGRHLRERQEQIDQLPFII